MRILSLTLAASLGLALPCHGQVPADLKAAMRARDSAFYAVDPVGWERYTAPTFNTVRRDGTFMTRAERVADLGKQKPQPFIPRVQEHNTRHGDVVIAHFVAQGSQVLEVWAMVNGRWQVLTSQITPGKP